MGVEAAAGSPWNASALAGHTNEGARTLEDDESLLAGFG